MDTSLNGWYDCKVIRFFTPLLLAILFLTACLPGSRPVFHYSWTYGDMRALDKAADIPPSLDLVAAYTRIVGDELQIRLDLLDLPVETDYDLYLALDTQQGGTEKLPLKRDADLAWDVLLIAPASGELRALDDQLQTLPNSGLRVLRDPLLDIVTISVKRGAIAHLPGIPLSWPEIGIRLQVFTTPAGAPAAVDQIGPLHSQDHPPPPAHVLFAFWNVYPAYTPAQALRRWDGAHTGPLGGRHGLYNLMRTARASEIPLFLLDLKEPAALSALDYLSQPGTKPLGLVREMANGGNLILPEVLPDQSFSPLTTPDWVYQRAHQRNSAVRRAFDLPASPFLYAPQGAFTTLTIARFVFTRTQDMPKRNDGYTQTNVFRFGAQAVLPIPNPHPVSYLVNTTDFSPSLQLKRALINTALSTSEGSDLSQAPVLVLGGDLPVSAWGAPQVARQAFRYIKAHPWIRILDANSLMGIRPQTPYKPNLPTSEDPSIPTPSPTGSHPGPSDDLHTALRNAPSNPIGQAAWDAYLALYAPVSPLPEPLPALRANYLRNVWALLFAAGWADRPRPASTCELDIDRDGVNECTLASEDFLIILEPEGGYLSFAFARENETIHQIIGPSSQIINGYSDPRRWDLDGGAVSDPTIIPGAFYDPSVSPEIHFQAVTRSSEIILTAPANSAYPGLQKTFEMTKDGLHVTYNPGSIPQNTTISIPLILDPWTRFRLGWADRHLNHTGPGWTWKIQEGINIHIMASSELTRYTFLDSRSFMGQPENPNRDYPPGHMLPFPLATVQIDTDGELDVWIEIKSTGRDRSE